MGCSGTIGSAVWPDTQPAPPEFAQRVQREAARRGFARASLEDWAEARCAELKAGRLDGLLATLRAHAASRETAAKCVGCIESNRQRLRHPDLRAQGLQIGPGVLEGALKTVVGKRLKQGGMRWTEDGADAVMALRCCIHSGHYEELLERHSDDRLAAAA